jgi:hypothetical protein
VIVYVRTFAVITAIIVVAIGLWLERRSQPSQVWRGYCPCCENPIRLPQPRCPYCRADLDRHDHRYALEFEYREFERGRLMRLRLAQALIAGAVLLFVITIVAAVLG